MSLPNDARVHFHCAFTIKPRQGAEDVWPEVIRHIRGWIERKENNSSGLHGAWFFTGGKWNIPTADLAVSVEDGSGQEDVPEFWALRYDHECRDVTFRRWRTDIGLTRQSDGAVSFRLRLIHYLRPGFVGDEPEAPVVTSPLIVKKLLQDRRWQCSAGSEELSTTPRHVGLGDVPKLVGRLEDKGRGCPIILVSAVQYEADRYLIDPGDLAFKVAGAASVYTISSTPDIFSEIQYLLPRMYQCVNGMVRLYMPGARLDDERDSRRHRYYSSWKIEELGEETVRKQVFRGLGRSGIEPPSATVADLEDVAVRRREISLAQMRLAATEAAEKGDVDELKRWIETLEEVNGSLEDGKKDLEQEREQLTKRIEQLEGEVEEAKQETAEKEHLRKQAWELKEQADERALDFQSASDILIGMEAFPSTLEEVIDLVEKLFPSRIVFLPEARSSADDWNFDPSRAWVILRSMATELYSLYFVEGCSTIEADFKTRTGIELSLKEGNQTRKNKQLMKLRERNYQGAEISIEPHVKEGVRKPGLLRVYYFADHENKLIVVGHCGDHLDTDGTRRKKIN